MKVGDVVCLGSNHESLMTVASIENGHATVCWFKRGDLETGLLPTEALVLREIKQGNYFTPVENPPSQGPVGCQYVYGGGVTGPSIMCKRPEGSHYYENPENKTHEGGNNMVTLTTELIDRFAAYDPGAWGESPYRFGRR